MDLRPDDTIHVSDELSLFVLRPEHVTENYLGWMQDPLVQRYLESRFSEQSMDTVRSFVERALADPDTLMMGIRLTETGEHVGNIKLGPINRNHATSEIGLMIGDRSAWGRGVGTMAIEGICKIARDRLGIRKVTAGATSGNAGSVRAFQKAGFAIEGRRPEQFQTDSGLEDLVLMGRIFRSGAP